MSCEPRPLPRPRVDLLAARVRWLDRYRRAVALGAAMLIAPLMLAQFAEEMGADWPRMHATLLSIMLGAVVWWVTEVGLVYVTALWETEHEQLIRERGLPRAILHRTR
jgi:hypothetical protein